jgi:RNA polymerase sigma-70 factor (sigma-E family)
MREFDQFVVEHVDELLRTAYLIVWDEREAEDLVQECLFKVARRWPRVHSMDRPVAYARRILVNLALDGSRGRARRRRELELAPAVPDAADEPFTAQDARAELYDALAGLPLRQRTVLVLRYFNDLTEAQAAEALGCSTGTVKSSSSRGLARLREALCPVTTRTRSSEP